MAKKPIRQERETSRRKRIVVPFYEDEFDQIAEKAGLEEVTGKNIRQHFGLKAIARQTGLNTKVRAKLSEKLKTMSEEEKAELLEQLE